MHMTAWLPTFYYAATIEFSQLHKLPDFGPFSRLFTDLSQIPGQFQVSKKSGNPILKTQKMCLLYRQSWHLSETTRCWRQTRRWHGRVELHLASSVAYALFRLKTLVTHTHTHTLKSSNHKIGLTLRLLTINSDLTLL